ncbi:hypothetical protein DPMN_026205 [Dreissena polymorpha]|uniref:Uncharacterized protein n=1 Tax=Dreissena polymorpha TaxID=45954 RepID=A0A9D4LQP6_DREPO|nr:hypothetical protein DPMN_026205 [Dreissena polymorpha]
MKSTLLCAFLVVCLAAAYVLGVPNHNGGIGGIRSGENINEYDGEMMDESDVGACLCRFLYCPSGYRKVGRCGWIGVHCCE